MGSPVQIGSVDFSRNVEKLWAKQILAKVLFLKEDEQTVVLG